MTATERELRALLAELHAAWLERNPATRNIRKRIERALRRQADGERE